VKNQPVEFLAEVEGDRFWETVRWIEWNPEQFPKKHVSFGAPSFAAPTSESISSSNPL
jgi:hypothetical protein